MHPLNTTSLPGPTRDSCSFNGLEAAHCCPLDLDGYAGDRERAGLDLRPGSGWRASSDGTPPSSPGLSALLSWPHPQPRCSGCIPPCLAPTCAGWRSPQEPWRRGTRLSSRFFGKQGLALVVHVLSKRHDRRAGIAPGMRWRGVDALHRLLGLAGRPVIASAPIGCPGHGAKLWECRGRLPGEGAGPPYGCVKVVQLGRGDLK